MQGYLAIDLMRKNNIELIKGVDRATTTTVSALRTAVIVAQALANQKLVLDQIDALNTTTCEMIRSTAELLANAERRHPEASGIVHGQRRVAAGGVREHLPSDGCDRHFKVEALSSMSTTINALEAEVAKAQTYVSRVRQADARESDGSLDIDS